MKVKKHSFQERQTNFKAAILCSFKTGILLCVDWNTSHLHRQVQICTHARTRARTRTHTHGERLVETPESQLSGFLSDYWAAQLMVTWKRLRGIVGRVTLSAKSPQHFCTFKVIPHSLFHLKDHSIGFLLFCFHFFQNLPYCTGGSSAPIVRKLNWNLFTLPERKVLIFDTQT